MQKTTKGEISSMKIIPNRVIVKLTRKEDELDLGNGNKIFIDPSFAREMHAPTVGIVVNFSEKLNPSLMRWKTTCELKLNDYVVFSYESSLHALGDDDSRALMDENKDLYVILDYEDLFVAKRGTKIIPLNGYVLCSPIPVEHKTSLVVPSSLKKMRSDKFVKIAHLGLRNEEYYNGDGSIREDLYDPMWVGKVGDTVLISKNCDLTVEYELHQSLSGRKETFFRVQRCYIKANIE